MILTETVRARARTALLLGGAVLVLGSVLAARQARGPTPIVVDGAVLHVGQTRWDLGGVKPGTVLQTSLTITNAGSRRLVINEDVCALCTADVLPTIFVAPGETTQVNLEWDTSGISGPMELTRRLLTNDPSRPRLDVEISAEAVAGDQNPSAR